MGSKYTTPIFDPLIDVVIYLAIHSIPEHFIKNNINFPI